MNDDEAPALYAISGGLGAFLAPLTPSSWPWYLEVPVVLGAAVAVYFAAKFYLRAKR